MLVADELVADVLAIILTLRARLVLFLAEEGFLLVDVRIESLQHIPRVVLKLLLDEIALLRQHVLDGVYVHLEATQGLSASLSRDVLKELVVLVEEETRDIFVSESFSALVSLNLHKFTRRVLFCQLPEDFLQECTFLDATSVRKDLLTSLGTCE